MLILLFMAVTSSTSAEVRRMPSWITAPLTLTCVQLIAVSSLLTFDVYKTYIKPDSSSAKLVQISHYGIILYALVLAAFCCVLNAVSINLTWLLTMLAIIVGGASIPVGLILLWKRMSTVAAVAAPWVSDPTVVRIMAWLTTMDRSVLCAG
jgi:urea-proton symporter